MIIRSTLFFLLLLAALPLSAQTACQETEPFYVSIVEFCVVPEFPSEDDEIFVRFVFVTPRSTFK